MLQLLRSSCSHYTLCLLTDQLFAVLVSVILSIGTFSTPSELLDFLVKKVKPHIAKRGEELIAQQITAVRDFAKWLSPIHLTLYNAFLTRGGIETAHSFAYKLRSALSPAECKRVQRMGELVEDDQGDAADVFCIVKMYMRDLRNNQEPVLVLPRDNIERVQGAVPADVVPPYALSTRREADLLALAEELLEEASYLPRAAAALKDLVVSRSYELVRLTWLESRRPTPNPNAIGHRDVHPLFNHLPETTWQLLVKKGWGAPKREKAI